MNPASDERVQSLVAEARPRVERAMALPDFTLSMAEANIFAVVGHRDLAERTAAAVKPLGGDAVAAAKRSLAEKYRGRNPERGWIGWVLFGAALSAALAAAFATGLRGGDPAAAAVVIIVVRARGGEGTEEIDLSIEHAYLDAIARVESGARLAQAELDADLDPMAAALIVRVRTAVFAELAPRNAELAAFDPLSPAGAAIIGSHTDPRTWLPPALAKTQFR